MRKPKGNGGSPLGPQGFGAAGLSIVPRLEELVADPWQVSTLDAHTARVLRTQAIAALIVLNGHDLDITHAEIEGHRQQHRDRLLNIDQACEQLSRKKDWLYRHHKELPFTVRHGKPLCFSELGIEDYIRQRRD
jgi:predicted DNA-binding transcriptional regulator AlpA